MQSDPKKNEGVATYSLKRISAKAFLKEEWSSTLMMIRVGNLVVINVYVCEGWKNEIINTMSRLSRQCVTDGLDIMVVGDFNLVPAEMQKVARRNELKLCPSPSEGTREGRTGSRNTLDYVMHNFGTSVSNPEIIAQLSTSDHELLSVKTTRKIAKPINSDTRRKVIRKGVDHKDILKALWVSNWPHT
jgi:hypothetical protein